MTKLTKIGWLILACYWVVAGLSCSRQPSVTVNSAHVLIDATGQSLVLNIPPQRIVSLAPSLTENVYLLGCGEQLVGVTIYCTYPEAAKSKAKIGTLLESDIEKIISLKPDLVLATKEGNKPEIIKALRKLGISVFVFDEAYSLTDIQTSITQLAQLLGKSHEAELLLAQVDERLKTVQARIKSLKPCKVFIQVGFQPVMTVAAGTFIDEIVGLAGGINIAQDTKTRYPIYNLEEIITQDPELIIVTDMGDIGVQAKEMWTKYPQLKAVQAGRVIILDTQATHDICAPTPEGFARSVETFARIIHPE